MRGAGGPQGRCAWRRRTPGALGPLLAAWLVACAPPAAERYEEELARTAPAAEHAVHAARLAELMRGLDRLTAERLPQAMDVQTERARRAERVRAAAEAVADSAARIPDAAGSFVAGLDEAERAVFTGLAETLEARAGRLAAEAAVRPAPELEAGLEEVRGVCDACHVRFRIPR